MPHYLLTGPVQGLHLGDTQGGSATPGNDWTTIGIFLIIAFLILGMACVNFVNLATARAGQRAREVALRKVLGANRKQLITQFLGESVLVAAVAMLLLPARRRRWESAIAIASCVLLMLVAAALALAADTGGGT